MHTFMDKIYSCYRNGLNGGQDMRSFSGLYFFMLWHSQHTPLWCYSMWLVHKYIYISQWSTIGIVLCITILKVTIAKPYRKPHMNYMDVLLLSNYIILYYMLSSGHHTQVVSRILITTPIAFLIVVTILQRYTPIKFSTTSDGQEHPLFLIQRSALQQTLQRQQSHIDSTNIKCQHQHQRKLTKLIYLWMTNI